MTREMYVKDSDRPVEEWGADRIHAAIENGSRSDWHRIAMALETDPRGKVAAELDEVLVAAWPSAAAETLGRVRLSALAHADAMERGERAAHLQGIFARSGLSMARFAERLGVTETHASTYLGGTESTPSDLMARAEEIS